MASVSFKKLSNKDSCIFYKAPRKLEVDVRTSPSLTTCNSLIQNLRDRGPFFAVGSIGPQSHWEKPYEMANKLEGKTIHSWGPNTHTTSKTYAINVLIIGAEIVKGEEGVYFTICSELEKDGTTNNGITYKVCRRAPDARIFYISFKIFNQYIKSLSPPVPFHDLHPNFVANNQLRSFFLTNHSWFKYVLKLGDMALEDITGSLENKCREILKKIFKIYKNPSSPLAAQQVIQNICSTLFHCTKDGSARTKAVEGVWARLKTE